MIENNNFSIASYYEKDHDRLDQLFEEYLRLKHTDFTHAKENFLAFKAGLQKHIAWEEDILFPIFEKKTGILPGPTSVMREEHRLIGEILESIHERVKNSDTSSNQTEQSLLLILGQHNLKEENVLYPALDRVLTEEEKSIVFKEMKNVPMERYEFCCSSIQR